MRYLLAPFFIHSVWKSPVDNVVFWPWSIVEYLLEKNKKQNNIEKL